MAEGLSRLDDDDSLDESSESSSGYSGEPFVHKRDQPKHLRNKKKTKKRAKQAGRVAAESSSSAFEDSVGPSNIDCAKEKFYDAQSCVTPPENPEPVVAIPVVGQAAVEVQPAVSQDTKTTEDQGNSIQSPGFRSPKAMEQHITTKPSVK